MEKAKKKIIPRAPKKIIKAKQKVIVQPIVKSWEVIMPEPYVLDTAIADEDIISEISSVKDDKSVAAVFSSALQAPTVSFIVTCTEEELGILFARQTDEYDCVMDEDNGVYILSILNKKGEFLGRGEISELGERITVQKLKTEFNKHMKVFFKKYKVGENRLGNLLYKLNKFQEEDAAAPISDISIDPNIKRNLN